MLEGNVLITGGTGFLGRGIMKYAPGPQYVVYSRDETKQDVCRRKFPDAHYVLGDVMDPDRLAFTCNKYNVDTIVHTAAIKYIPEAELNVNEAIGINVVGSRVVCEVARTCNVRTVVGISTDKAVMPVNVYGATKMLMERIFGEYSGLNSVKYVLTRYGNVVGSTGSVIPMFQSRIAESKHIDLTDPAMTRYWLSIKDAVNLVEHATVLPNGYMIVPDAKAMTMEDLAKALGPATIGVIGARPGEKRHENMMHQYESVRASYTVGGFYKVAPVGTRPDHGEIATMCSADAERLTPEEMLEYIEMAKCV